MSALADARTVLREAELDVPTHAITTALVAIAEALAESVPDVPADSHPQLHCAGCDYYGHDDAHPLLPNLDDLAAAATLLRALSIAGFALNACSLSGAAIALYPASGTAKALGEHLDLVQDDRGDWCGVYATRPIRVWGDR